MGRPKKQTTEQAFTAPEYEGVRQVGDASIFDDQNAHLAEQMTHTPEIMVRPNDLVYKDPTKRFKFALADDTRGSRQAAELTRWRRKGYFKVTEDNFVSPTGRFDLIDGAWCYDTNPWYAIPIERYRDNQRLRQERIGNVAETTETLVGDIEAAGDGQVEAFSHVERREGVRRSG
ncbi:MAG: hypothetical protein LC732_09415 [Acidobacteria bacterium]|nr:hypothetical protein [Acidobacteriota bacterium]